MKENEMITPENFEDVKVYLDENYKCGHIGTALKHGTAIRHFESIDGSKTIMYVSTFEGERTRSVRAYLSVTNYDERDFIYDKARIEREIFTLDELKELESKVMDLNEFVKQLGLWRV